MKNLESFFSPKSIAIYGLSTNPEKISSTILSNLIDSGYEGKVFGINPKYTEIGTYKCYPDAVSIPEPVDMAVIAIPAEGVLGCLDDCAKKTIKNVIVISAGFGETGEKGKELEAQLKAKAEQYDMNLLGPNCLGMIVSDQNMNASFAGSNTLPGSIAFISQSGAMCTAILDSALIDNLGFSHFISVGNKTVINENDLTEYLLKDSKVNVIGAYLEDFEKGSDFITIKQNLGIEKPICMLVPGKSEEAQKAAISHTGSLTSGSKIISAGLNKAGIVRCNSVAQLYSLMMAFDWSKRPEGRNVAILSNAGGVGIIATDAIVGAGLKIAKLSDDTQAKLKEKLPATASVHNPIDVIGDARADRYQSCLEILAQAPEVNSILLILTPQVVTEIEDTAKLIINFSKMSDKPVIPVFLGGEYAEDGIKRMHNNKIASYDDLNLAVYVLAKLTEYEEYIASHQQAAASIQPEASLNRIDLSQYLSDDLTPLPEDVVLNLLNQFEIPVAKSRVVSNIEEAKSTATEIGYPIVLKASTKDIVHKTDAKAVYTNINSVQDLEAAFNALMSTIASLKGSTEGVGLLMQEQVKADVELFIGAKKDRSFGHSILFGMGGIYTQVFEDIAQSLVPMSEKQVEELIDKTKVSKVINGYRGTPLDKADLIQTILKIQRLLVNYPEIAEIDVNPVMLTQSRCILVDTKVFVKR